MTEVIHSNISSKSLISSRVRFQGVPVADVQDIANVELFVPTIADLRAIDVTTIVDGTPRSPLGYYAAHDVAMPQYLWDSASTANDHGGTAIRPNSVGQSQPGRWVAPVGQQVYATWFGILPDRTTDNVPAYNRMIAWINETGGAASLHLPISVRWPDGDYNFRSGLGDPILVSNVNFVSEGKAAHIHLETGPFVKLGSATQLIENFSIDGFLPYTNTTDTTTDETAFVEGVNCVRVFIRRAQPFILPKLFRAYPPAGASITTIFIYDIYGLGKAGNDFIDIDTSGSSAGAAGLYVSRVNAFPFIPPANPKIVPTAITGITLGTTTTIAAAGHQLSTGDRVRLFNIQGTTQLNNRDFTVSVINDTTFTLDGVDSSGYGAYVSGGLSAGLHWSWQYPNSAVVSIRGKWDTFTIAECVCQHWAWFYLLEGVNGPISFVSDISNIWDFGGFGRARVTFSGGSISQWNISEGWNFSLNGPMIQTLVNGGGAILALKVKGLTVGLCGGNVLVDEAGRISTVVFSEVRLQGVGRAPTSEVVYILRFLGSATRLTAEGVIMQNPITFSGAGADAMLPTHGISLGQNVGSAIVRGCSMRSQTTDYDIPESARIRILAGNVRANELPPEYLRLVIPAVGPSPFTWKNQTGVPMTVYVTGGNVTSVQTNYIDGTGTETFLSTGQTQGCFIVGVGQSLQLTYTVVPTFRAFPLNN